MKGFGIYVKNDLLEPKHFKAIGQALWLYLWLLDKMTSISEDGVGKVLGGVPIKFEKINSDLPMSPSSYTRYIKALEQAGYITALRTPYGHVFKITKAKKIFKNRENHKKAESQKKRITNVTAENHKCDGNKEDNTVDNTYTSSQSEGALKANQKDMWKKYKEPEIDIETGEAVGQPEKKKKVTAEMKLVFDLFNPKLSKVWQMREIERVSAQTLYDQHGIETLSRRVRLAKEESKKGDQFFPIIDTPSKFLKAEATLERYFNQ